MKVEKTITNDRPVNHRATLPHAPNRRLRTTATAPNPPCGSNFKFRELFHPRPPKAVIFFITTI